MREYTLDLDKYLFQKGYGTIWEWEQRFGWAEGNFDYGYACCKAYMADIVVRDPEALKKPYVVWRVNKTPYDPARTEEYIRTWEAALGVGEPTEILTTQLKHVILVQPSQPWLYGPPGVHFHTLLVRTAVDWPGNTNPLEHIYVTNSGMMSGYSDATYAARGRHNITRCLEARTLPFKTYTWDTYRNGTPREHSMGTHSDGIVDLKGDPLE